MCLQVKLNWFQKLFKITPRLKIAKHDIKVYKLLREGEKLESPFFPQIWTPGKLATSPIIIVKGIGRCFVEIGFHSLLDPEDKFPWAIVQMYNAVIPKGSFYLIGDFGDIVSDQLIITSRYEEEIR